MTIEVLVCRPDGTQSLESRELPEDYLPLTQPGSGAPAE
jgi:hypothetical protein